MTGCEDSRAGEQGEINGTIEIMTEIGQAERITQKGKEKSNPNLTTWASLFRNNRSTSTGMSLSYRSTLTGMSLSYVPPQILEGHMVAQLDKQKLAAQPHISHFIFPLSTSGDGRSATSQRRPADQQAAGQHAGDTQQAGSSQHCSSRPAHAATNQQHATADRRPPATELTKIELK
uniref:Uncharacterized protein n=1 Tax=Solanum tuberosum TaxID=4113 RepID=M1DSF6_SOLTU